LNGDALGFEASHRKRQHAVLELGLDGLGIEPLMQAERTPEARIIELALKRAELVAESGRPSMFSSKLSRFTPGSSIERTKPSAVSRTACCGMRSNVVAQSCASLQTRSF